MRREVTKTNFHYSCTRLGPYYLRFPAILGILALHMGFVQWGGRGQQKLKHQPHKRPAYKKTQLETYTTPILPCHLDNLQVLHAQDAFNCASATNFRGKSSSATLPVLFKLEGENEQPPIGPRSSRAATMQQWCSS